MQLIKVRKKDTTAKQAYHTQATRTINNGRRRLPRLKTNCYIINLLNYVLHDHHHLNTYPANQEKKRKHTHKISVYSKKASPAPCSG